MSRPRTRAQKRLRWLEAFLFLAGFAGLSIWGWSYARTYLYQREADRVLDTQINKRVRPETATPAQSPTPPRRPAPPPNGTLIGRLTIPRVKVRAAVREGADDETLDVALGHIPGTALPGQSGNVGVAGHRDALFRGLRNIRKNDVIHFQTATASYQYLVDSTSIVKPKDVGVLAPGPHSEMTLVTCYPFNYIGSAPDRFIVKARLLETPFAAPVPVTTSKREVMSVEPRANVHPPAKPVQKRSTFLVTSRHTREVAPGILLGLTWTDPGRRRANGWLWVGDQHRTIWLRDQAAQHPVYVGDRELMITRVDKNSVAGYLTAPLSR